MDGSCIEAERVVVAAFCDLETVAMFAEFAAVAEINYFDHETQLIR